MSKITLVSVLALLTWFSGSALAYSTCDPNSPAVPCTYDGRDFDTVMYNSGVKAFYKAASYLVDHSINNDPDLRDIKKFSGPPCGDGIVWVYGTYYSSFCGASVNSTDAGYGWAGRGANVWQYFSFPRAGYTAYDA